MSIYLYKNNQQYGLYEESTIQEMLQARTCSANDLAICEGMTEWQPLNRLLEFQGMTPINSKKYEKWTSITLPESSLFLLLLSSDIDTMNSELIGGGELSEKEEEFILKCVTKWGFYDDFYSQTQLQSAIDKYQHMKGRSISVEDFIEQCAEVLTKEPPFRDITFYLCLEILFLDGKVEYDSKEEIYIRVKF